MKLFAKGKFQEPLNKNCMHFQIFWRTSFIFEIWMEMQAIKFLI